MGWFIPPLTAAVNAVRLGAGAPAWAKALYYGGAPLSGAAAITGGVSQIDFELNKHGLDWRGNPLPEESITQGEGTIDDPYNAYIKRKSREARNYTTDAYERRKADEPYQKWAQRFDPTEDDPYNAYIRSRNREARNNTTDAYERRLNAEATNDWESGWNLGFDGRHAEPTTDDEGYTTNKYGRGPLSAQPWDEFGWENDNSNSKINPNWVGELGDRIQDGAHYVEDIFNLRQPDRYTVEQWNAKNRRDHMSDIFLDTQKERAPNSYKYNPFFKGYVNAVDSFQKNIWNPWLNRESRRPHSHFTE